MPRKPVPGMCDVCGQPCNLNRMRFNDRGGLACPQCWEPEHPQKYLKSWPGDPAPLPNTRPDSVNPVAPTFTCPDITISATGGTATFQLTRSVELSDTDIIYWKLYSASAISGRDYQATPLQGQLTFAPLETLKTVPVTVNNISPLAAQRVFYIEFGVVPTVFFPLLRSYCRINP